MLTPARRISAICEPTVHCLPMTQVDSPQMLLLVLPLPFSQFPALLLSSRGPKLPGKLAEVETRFRQTAREVCEHPSQTGSGGTWAPGDHGQRQHLEGGSRSGSVHPSCLSKGLSRAAGLRSKASGPKSPGQSRKKETPAIQVP